MSLRCVLSAIAWLAFSPMAQATEITLISDREVCESTIPDGKNALVVAERRGDEILLKVTTMLNCAYKAGAPTIDEGEGAATIELTLVRPEEDFAMLCLCAHEITASVRGLHADVKTLYVLQEGFVLGHVSAP